MQKDILGNYVKIKTGKLDANENAIDGVYPFFTCSQKTLKINSYSFDGEYVLVAGNGDLNVKYYSGKFDAYQRTYAITSINTKVLNNKYLYYFLITYIDKLRNQSIGGVIKYIKLENLTDAMIPIVPIDRQKEIVEILDMLTNLRLKRQESIQKLDELLQAVFYEMFGDPIKNTKKWEIKTLTQLLSFMTSGSRGWAKYYSDNGDIFLTIKNVGNNTLLLDNLTFINPPNNAESKRAKLELNDVVISITADLGRTAVVDKNIGDAYINQHLAILRTKNDIEPHYLSTFLGSEGGQSQIQKLNKGAAKAGLNFADIQSINIPLPPRNLQDKFAKILQRIEQQRQLLLESQKKNDELFQSLLQKAFSGELELNDTETAHQQSLFHEL
jgi:type I restriction enzyme S subunit